MAESSQKRFPTEELHFRETPVKLLMQSRIEDILLVCSKYDKFMLEEDGRVDEQIFQEYVTLNLRYPPKFTQVSTADGAISELARRSYDMVITMLNIGNVRSLELAEQIREHHPHIPVVVLTPFSREVSARLSNEDLLDDYHIFAWLGDDSILLAVVKLIEDRMNVEADVKAAGVQTIILVEDSVRYYSSYLPVIYRALYQQARGLMEEGLNEWQQTMRMRCRPKILLATTFEEAVQLYNTYRDNLLGVISDISYKRNGEVDQYAGLRLCDYIREDNPSLPILLQSSERKHRAEAERYNADFLFKHSKNLLTSLRRYIRLNYGFGDFLFRNPDTQEVIARASDLQDLQRKILDISDESFTYHVERHDFAGTEFVTQLVQAAANEIGEPIEVANFRFGGLALQHNAVVLVGFRSLFLSCLRAEYYPGVVHGRLTQLGFRQLQQPHGERICDVRDHAPDLLDIAAQVDEPYEQRRQALAQDHQLIDRFLLVNVAYEPQWMLGLRPQNVSCGNQPCGLFTVENW